jgi:hypothetical protein
MNNQTNLSLGIPSSLQQPAKHYVSPDSKHKLYVTEPLLLTTKQKMASLRLLTPDNAVTVLSNAFDVSAFTDALANDTSVI